MTLLAAVLTTVEHVEQCHADRKECNCRVVEAVPQDLASFRQRTPGEADRYPDKGGSEKGRDDAAAGAEQGDGR